jgi:hypothetical protein
VVTVAVCGFSLYSIRRNYLRDKCLWEDTATSPTVGLFGMELNQYVVMYTVHIVESSVLKGPLYLHRRVMKPTTTVSSCVKAKLSKCGVTSDRKFEICIFKSHGDPSKRGFTSLRRTLSVIDGKCNPGCVGQVQMLCVDITLHPTKLYMVLKLGRFGQ